MLHKRSIVPLTLALAVIFTLVPTYSRAERADGKLQSEVWRLDSTVRITGSYLRGPSPSLSKLCFAPLANRDNLSCFSLEHGNILEWGETVIRFIPPINVPPIGVVLVIHPERVTKCQTLYKKFSCKTVTEREETEVGQYVAHPHISNIVNVQTGETATKLEKGAQYRITGYRMGDSGMGIFINNHMMGRTDIDEWTYDSILFTPSESYPTESELRVHNGAGKGEAWILGTTKVAAEQGTEKEEEEKEEENTEELPPEIVETGNSAQKPIQQFSDVEQDNPYFAPVHWAVTNGIVGGYGDETFRGENLITRAEFIKMMLESYKTADLLPIPDSDPFPDISTDDWFAPYIAYAKDNGMIEGDLDQLFHPHRTINIAEALKIAYRHMQIPTLDSRDNRWYARYVEHAQNYNVFPIDGFIPGANLTRQDGVWMLWRLTAMHDYLALPNPDEVIAKRDGNESASPADVTLAE